MATKEQVSCIKKLIETVKVEDETVTKWMTKADVDSWEEMTAETIQKCIDFLQKKVSDVTKIEMDDKKEIKKKEKK